MTPDEIRNVSFRKPPIGQRGYDETSVDLLLDRVEASLRGTRSISRHELATAAAALPKPPMGKRGYDKDEVDAFIQRVAVDISEMRTQRQAPSPASAGDHLPVTSEVRTQWQGPSIVAPGEHRPRTQVACVYGLLWASVGAVVAGMNIDFIVVTGDPNFGTPGYVVNASRRLALTGGAVAVMGPLVFWALSRVVALSLVWDKGGLAYRGWTRRRGAIAWRDITAIQPKEGSGSLVVIKARMPAVDREFELLIGSAGSATLGRWSVWSHSRQELIRVLERARAAALTVRFPPPPPPPPPPPAPKFLLVLIPAWVPLATAITVAVYAVDRGSNFALQHAFWDGNGGG